jgi:hypothetical protein
MAQVYIGGILMVLGMFSLLANPVLGGIILAVGYGLFATTKKSTRAAAESTFWGLALLCGAIVTVVAILGMIF